jgi:rhodanese-related sulfurtransferase
MPVWRALGGIVQIERDGISYVLERDRDALFVDSRDPEQFQAGSLPGARNIPLAEIGQAMTDGRLPMEDPSRRIVVFGTDGVQSRDVAQALARRGALINVAYFDGSFETILALAP